MLSLDLMLDMWTSRANGAVCAVHGELQVRCRAPLGQGVVIHLHVQSYVENGYTYEEAWNSLMIDLCNASVAHCQYIVVRNFVDGVKVSAACVADGEPRVMWVRRKLKTTQFEMLLRVSAYSTPYDLSKATLVDFSRTDILPTIKLYVCVPLVLVLWVLRGRVQQAVREAVRILLDDIRPDAVGLVDAFNFSDEYVLLRFCFRCSCSDP